MPDDLTVVLGDELELGHVAGAATQGGHQRCDGLVAESLVKKGLDDRVVRR